MDFFDASPEVRQLYVSAYNELQRELPNVPLPTSVIEARMAQIAARPAPLYSIEFDEPFTGTFGQMAAQGFFTPEGFGDEISPADVKALAVGESLHFGGGAAPLGSVTRVR